MKNSNPVAVIDDDEAIREAIGIVLDSVGIGAKPYETAVAFLEDPDARACACMVLDVRMPGLSGVELQRRLREMQWDLPIIFISGHGDVGMAVEAMKRGAVDFLQKPFRDQQLIDAVQAVLARACGHEGAEGDRGRFRARLDQLTPRERDVFDGIVRGLRGKEIAHELGIAVKTVDEYRARVFRKMAVRNLAELVALATTHGASRTE